ncbi:hypothetical protein EES40_07050 [Streptomyces sp. ADI93-02]|nr:hypothetical protein EES40_07050 [Streptomyces sp. ADI93-02]
MGQNTRRPRTPSPDRRHDRHRHLPRRGHARPDRRRARTGRGPPHGAPGTGRRQRRVRCARARRWLRGHPQAVRAGRQARDPLRGPARPPQGPGHADPRAAGGTAGRPRCDAPAGRRRPPPTHPAAAGRGHRDSGLRRPGGRAAPCRHARVLRGGRRLRDAVPHPACRSGGGGAGHRLPGGGRGGTARPRRGLGRGPRRRTRRRERPSRGRPGRARDRRPPRRAPEGPGERRGHGRAWTRVGPYGMGVGTDVTTGWRRFSGRDPLDTRSGKGQRP